MRGRLLFGELSSDCRSVHLTDGETVDLQDRRSKHGGALVLCPRIPWHRLEQELGLDDRLVGGVSGPSEARLRLPGGRVMRLASGAEGWDLDPYLDPSELQAAVAARWQLVYEHLGLCVEEPSASGAAAHALRAELGKTVRQLRPRWRTLAHEATHVGPCEVYYGGGTAPVVTIDLKGAYLRGMTQELPTPGSWVAIGPWCRWDRVRKHAVGLVRAFVEVPSVGWRCAGPLPRRVSRRASRPVGRFIGSWTFSQLRLAEELSGVRVLGIIEGAYAAQTAPYLAPLAERLWRMREGGREAKATARAIYTRLWGVLLSRGRWEGAPIAADLTRPLDWPRRYMASSSLAWVQTGHGRELSCPAAPPLYRPDWAAFISGWTEEVMSHGLRVFAGDLVSAHVDSLSVEVSTVTAQLKVQEAIDSGLWAIKRHEGRARVWGVGLGVYSGEVLHAGLKSASALAVARYARRRVFSPSGQRWTQGGPAKHRQAEARPSWARTTLYEYEQEAHGWDGDKRPSIWSPRWSPQGWERSGETQTRLPPPDYPDPLPLLQAGDRTAWEAQGEREAALGPSPWSSWQALRE